MQHLLKPLAGGAAIAALLLFSPPAEAVVVSQGGTYAVTWSDEHSSGNTSTSLDASLSLSNFDFSGTNTVSFQVDISNNTQQGTLSASDFASIRITSFGFNMDPNATGVTDTSTEYEAGINNQQPLPSFGKLDFCAFAGSNCAGGSNGGLTPGESDSFLVTLNFATDITELEIGLDSISELSAIKWQADFGSFEHASDPPNCPPGTPGCVVNPPIDVPEPASLAILGSSLLVAGAVAARRRRHRS